MGYLTERLLHTEHEEGCCCGECGCENEHNHEEEIVEKSLSESEIEEIINEKYSEKDEKTKEFIRRSLRIHGLKYDYSKTFYIKLKSRVIITCLVHGDFEQTPDNHLLGKGCAKCSGNKKLTTEEFIEQSKKVHNNRYDYSKVNYINNHTKVIIICPVHGEFEQTPSVHLRGCGCPFCSNNVKLTTEEFIKRAKEVHGNKYDYSKVNYTNANSLVTIVCPIHGEFVQIPSSHLIGRGCSLCGHSETSKKLSSSTEDFILKAKSVHGDKYDYSKVNYINAQSYVTIICPIHGEFIQRASNHLLGIGCPFCSNNVKLTTEEFIKRAKEVHGEGTFIYDRTNYIDSKTPVEIYDPLYNEYFFQTASSHLQGHSPNNRISMGERLILRSLQNLNIEFEREVELGCVLVNSKVRVDFLIKYPENIIIEYNGLQHYKRINFFQETIDEFNRQIKRDSALGDYCKINGIKLITIPYTLSDYDSVFDFLTKTIIEGIDPQTLIDYDSLYVFDDNNST